MTSAWAALALLGPRADGLLASLGPDLSPGEDAIRHVELGHAPAMLVPWLRPKGLYLMVSSEFALHLHDRLAAAGDGFGLRHAGSLAAEGLAVEAGVPRFGTEMSPNIPAAAANLDRLLDVEGNRGFIGRAAGRNSIHSHARG